MQENLKKVLTNNKLNVIIIIVNEREVNSMSYSPYAVLGTSARIKANRDRLKENQPTVEKKEEQKVDYTELLRKTYFPHRASSE